MKLRSQLAIVSVAAVGISGSTWLLVASHNRALQENVLVSSQVLAATVADLAVGPLIFDDRAGAADLLGGLKANETVLQAVVLDQDGEVFAAFARPGQAARPSRLARAPFSGIEGNRLVAGHPIRHAGDQMGTLYLEMSVASHRAQVLRGNYRVLWICLALICVCGVLAWQLQGLVTRPILALADVARRISREGVAGERAEYRGRDEIGTLYAAFNAMLDQVQARSRERDESEARLRALLGALPDLIFAVDAEGRFREVLATSADLGVAEPSQSMGRPMGEPLPSGVSDSARQIVRATLADGQNRRFEYELSDADGTRSFEAVAAALPPGPQNPESLVLFVAREISERKRLEQQLRLAREVDAVGRLAGSIAHDFNNLLTGIVGYTELLNLRHPGSPELEEIRGIAHRGADLVGQLLSLSRPGEGPRTLVDVNVLVSTVAGIIGCTTDPSIDVAMELWQSPLTVCGDATKLQAAILNLGVNACDAMPQGGKVTLSTRLRPVEHRPSSDSPDAERVVDVIVTDSGHGVPEAIRSRIFEPFFTTKEKGRGTGLGLAAVYGTARGHGGDVTFTTRAGHATSFCLSVPHHPPAEAAPANKCSPELLAGRGRILFADDEVAVRTVAARMLESVGYEVVVVEDGREAVVRFESERSAFDLIILDVIMPNVGGIEAAARMRALTPAVKLLFITGFTPWEGGSPRLEDGAVVLAKPFTRETLAGKVAELLVAG